MLLMLTDVQGLVRIVSAPGTGLEKVRQKWGITVEQKAKVPKKNDAQWDLIVGRSENIIRVFEQTEKAIRSAVATMRFDVMRELIMGKMHLLTAVLVLTSIVSQVVPLGKGRCHPAKSALYLERKKKRKGQLYCHLRNSASKTQHAVY